MAIVGLIFMIAFFIVDITSLFFPFGGEEHYTTTPALL